MKLAPGAIVPVIEGENVNTAETIRPFFFDFVGTLPGDIVKQDLDKRPGLTLPAAFILGAI